MYISFNQHLLIVLLLSFIIAIVVSDFFSRWQNVVKVQPKNYGFDLYKKQFMK
jgi:hypothetical protein